MKKRSIKGKKLPHQQLKSTILRYFKNAPGKRVTAKQISKNLKITNNKNAIKRVLHELEHQDAIFQLKPGIYRLSRSAGSAEKTKC